MNEIVITRGREGLIHFESIIQMEGERTKINLKKKSQKFLQKIKCTNHRGQEYTMKKGQHLQ